MKSVVQVKLLPSPEQAELLRVTVHACNREADRISRVMRERAVRKKFDLHHIVYGDAKTALGGAQSVARTIGKVYDAYTTHRANLKAGNYGKKGTRRRAVADAKVISFRPDAAQPYDDRILSWKHDSRMVSIWVTDTSGGTALTPTPGRIFVPFTGKVEHLEAVAAHRKGESDLVCRDGMWFLLPTLDRPDVEPMLGHGRSRAPAGPETTNEDWVGSTSGSSTSPTPPRPPTGAEAPSRTGGRRTDISVRPHNHAAPNRPNVY